MHSIHPNFRSATDEDIPAIVDLVNLAYRDTEHRGWTTEADIVCGDRIDADRIHMLLKAPNSMILIMTLEHTIRACVHIEAQKDAIYLGMLTVDPRLQNQGLGKRMLELAENYASEIPGANRIAMIVVAQRDELIAYYQRRGYQSNGQTLPYPVGQNVGTPKVKELYMVKLFKDIR
jgi:ribosomal protein S18 acetylase RimI-like enzyme